MYGKSFESMYTGSMVGAGFHVFAVWQYVITNTHHSHIELNPRLLAFTLAGNESEETKVQEALDYLCAPDPKSRSQIEDGRRLIKEGQYLYRVVNWEEYQRIKSMAELKDYNRRKQAEYRARKKLNGEGLTPKQKSVFDKAKKEEYEKRRVNPKRLGTIAGATQAVDETLKESNEEANHGLHPDFT